MTTVASNGVSHDMKGPTSDKKNGYTIVNVSFSGHYDMEGSINLKGLSERIDGAKKDDGFSGLVWKGGSCTMLLFKNGKFVLTGVKKMEDADTTIETMKSLLVKGGYVVKGFEKHVTNLVRSGTFPRPVNLISFVKMMDNTRYEPGVFPGLIYYDHGSTFLVFGNGKYICHSASDDEKAGESIALLEGELEANGLYM